MGLPNYFEPDEDAIDLCEDGHLWDDQEELLCLDDGEQVSCRRGREIEGYECNTYGFVQHNADGTAEVVRIEER